MNYFIVYEECCFYEIVILSYFMKYTNQEIKFCTPDGAGITCMEGFRVAADLSIEEVEVSKSKSIILTGGNINNVRSDKVIKLFQEANEKEILIGAICAGVDILEEAEILQGIQSTHSTELDAVTDKNIITARANAYVDFAIEVAKKQKLFVDDADLQETVNFWKYHKRM